MRFISWNVNGIRAAVKKNLIGEIENFDADFICFQETKAQDDQVLEALKELEGYHIHTSSAVKKGYSGVAILSKEEPLSMYEGIDEDRHDDEGRVLTLEYEDFYLVNVYVPNSGNGLKRLDYREEWDGAFAQYLQSLIEEKPIIVTGDLNVAHSEIDLARPKSNYNKTSGYTQVEIDGLDGILEVGLLDSFRDLYPDKVQYSYWSFRMGARARNVGWRIDYFLVDHRLRDQINDAIIHDQVHGSDHCPIELDLEI